ncbi:MAG TPA: hypothetical protein VNS32_09650 [Flavisolibacter sp.]|nr:hypothetical protein [Flavisolibacter sp.]
MFQLVDISSYSIIIAGLIAIVRFKNINKVYYPFLICLWIGCLNEFLSGVIIKFGYTTIANGNIYVLCESLLLLWYFSNSGLFYKSRLTLPILVGLFLAIWASENFMYHTLLKYDNYFRISYSFILVILSINAINKIIVSNRKNILLNADFLLCMGFIIYFAYKVLVQAFAIYGYKSTSMSFLIAIYDLMLYINLCINLVYALAVLWMPKRLAYIYPL